MPANSYLRTAVRWLADAVVLLAIAYATYVCIAWLRYGRTEHLPDEDAELNRFIPAYDVSVRNQIRVAATADRTFAAASEMDIQQAAIVRAIFKGRALILGSKAANANAPTMGIVEQAKAWGLGVLAEKPGREIVFGTVTRPWEANPVFRAVPPAEFLQFHEPGYVKIVWTLRVDALGANTSVLRTETRVATTDPDARSKFRRYWAFFSPGMFTVRCVALRMVKAEAEQHARERSPVAK
jgi:hypothetical protein